MPTHLQISQTPVPEQTVSSHLVAAAVDIFEESDAFLLMADIPGTDETSTDVTMDKELLTIRSRPEPLQKLNCYSLVYSEFTLPNYERQIRNTGEIGHQRIRAKVTNGTLRLRLPKLAEPMATKNPNCRCMMWINGRRRSIETEHATKRRRLHVILRVDALELGQM